MTTICLGCGSCPCTISNFTCQASTPQAQQLKEMEQRSINSFLVPKDTPSRNMSHKRAASSSLSTLQAPATKLKKVEETTKSPENPTKNQSIEPSTESSADDDNEQRQTTSPTLTLSYRKGDIFAAPQGSLLIHACNVQGSWGSGIAAAFRARYPAAYKIYREYCVKTHNPMTRPIPTGTCLLIPPSETSNGKPKHWIGCLFTSAKYGRFKDTPTVILQNTGRAMKHLLVEILQAEKDDVNFEELRMCMINSGKFGVPWRETVEVLETVVIEEGWKEKVDIWSVD